MSFLCVKLLPRLTGIYLGFGSLLGVGFLGAEPLEPSWFSVRVALQGAVNPVLCLVWERAEDQAQQDGVAGSPREQEGGLQWHDQPTGGQT